MREETEPLHVLQVIPNLNSGGAERFICDLTNRLHVLGIRVSVLTLYDIEQGNALLEVLHNEVEVISLSKRKGFDSALMPKMRKIVIEKKPDIIHTHLRSINYVALSTLGLGLPIVHTVHNEASKEVANRLEAFVRLAIFKCLSVFPVTISKESDRSFREFYRVLSIKTKLIENGRDRPEKSASYPAVVSLFDELRAGYGKDVKLLVAIGRLVDAKNHILLSKAIKEVVKGGANVVALILGGAMNGSEETIRELEAEANPRMIMAGVVDNPTDYLFLADYFVLSSKYEGMPISLIEAFACGCVPVCTPVGAIPDMIGDDGLISTGFSVSNFAEAILEALSYSRNHIQKINSANRAKFNDIYDMKTCAEKYLEFYVKLTRA